MARLISALACIAALLSACGTTSSSPYNGQVNRVDSADEAAFKRQREARLAFDRVSTASSTEQWGFAVKLRQDFASEDEYVDTLWATRSSQVSLAWLIGMSNAPRRDAASLKRFPADKLKNDNARAELWLRRGMQEAAKRGDALLPELRYDYARVLFAQGKASTALEVLANRSEVEPQGSELEALYQSLLTDVIARLESTAKKPAPNAGN